MGKSSLGRCSRLELLELLKGQMEENERLRERIGQLERELEDRRIKIEGSGSLAEAALKLAGVFEAADEAVRLYKESVGYEEKPSES